MRQVVIVRVTEKEFAERKKGRIQKKVNHIEEKREENKGRKKNKWENK